MMATSFANGNLTRPAMTAINVTMNAIIGVFQDGYGQSVIKVVDCY